MLMHSEVGTSLMSDCTFLAFHVHVSKEVEYGCEGLIRTLYHHIALIISSHIINMYIVICEGLLCCRRPQLLVRKMLQSLRNDSCSSTVRDLEVWLIDARRPNFTTCYLYYFDPADAAKVLPKFKYYSGVAQTRSYSTHRIVCEQE